MPICPLQASFSHKLECCQTHPHHPYNSVSLQEFFPRKVPNVFCVSARICWTKSVKELAHPWNQKHTSVSVASSLQDSMLRWTRTLWKLSLPKRREQARIAIKRKLEPLMALPLLCHFCRHDIAAETLQSVKQNALLVADWQRYGLFLQKVDIQSTRIIPLSGPKTLLEHCSLQRKSKLMNTVKDKIKFSKRYWSSIHVQKGIQMLFCFLSTCKTFWYYIERCTLNFGKLAFA